MTGAQRQLKRGCCLGSNGSFYTAPSRQTDDGVHSLHPVGSNLGLHRLQRREILVDILDARRGQCGAEMCQYWDDLRLSNQCRKGRDLTKL